MIRTSVPVAALLLGALCSGGAAETPPSPKCASPEYRRLDFWAGDWDAFDVGGSPKASARAQVDIILGGCALREVYEQEDGLVGQSFTIYDASRKLWHQSWVTNRGGLLQIDGRFEGDSLTLQGHQLLPDGRDQIVRGVWRPQGNGVRETAHSSADGGATWQPYFDILFQHHQEKPMTARDESAGEDARTVAALDTEYQAAVKRNDAAAMDRILSDDFILVTGRGKVFTKADLLNEARSQKAIYECQEDSSQKVRVWGDTAVVTALLWARGTEEGKPFEYKLWFSDTYLRTKIGWRYVFAQSSIPLPPER